MIKELNNSNFEIEVLQAEGLILVDFWAIWCAPCRALSPLVEEISKEFAGKIKVCKLDIETCKEIPVKYGIRTIPTILFFKNGNIVDRTVGAIPKTILATKVSAWV